MSLREHRLFKFIARPIVAFAIMAGLFMVLFPDWGPRDLSIFVRLPPEPCAAEVTASAFSGDALARSTSRPIRGERSLETTFALPRGDYRVSVDLGCSDGRISSAAEQRVDLHQHADLSFDVSRKCPCSSP